MVMSEFVPRPGGAVTAPCDDIAMKSIAIKVVVNALAIWVATLVVPQVGVTEGTVSNQALTLLLVGALFVVVNAFIKPVVKLFSLPFYILTLGLFAFVVNALMLKLVEWLSEPLGIGFDAGPFFWSTIGAAVVVTFVSMLLNVVLPDGKKK
jgi:putative membrane protein